MSSLLSKSFVFQADSHNFICWSFLRWIVVCYCQPRLYILIYAVCLLLFLDLPFFTRSSHRVANHFRSTNSSLSNSLSLLSAIQGPAAAVYVNLKWNIIFSTYAIFRAVFIGGIICVEIDRQSSKKKKLERKKKPTQNNSDYLKSSKES